MVHRLQEISDSLYKTIYFACVNLICVISCVIYELQGVISVWADVLKREVCDPVTTRLSLDKGDCVSERKERAGDQEWIQSFHSFARHKSFLPMGILHIFHIRPDHSEGPSLMLNTGLSRGGLS